MGPFAGEVIGTGVGQMMKILDQRDGYFTNIQELYAGKRTDLTFHGCVMTVQDHLD